MNKDRENSGPKSNQPGVKYYAVYKPYDMLPQFTDPSGRKTLGLLFDFPKDVYAVGRLDKDSEGLLLLTNDKSLNHLLLDPQFKHEREYLVQVEGIPQEKDLKKFEEGLIVENRKTLPAKAILLTLPPEVPERMPPIRIRKTVPDSWLRITLCEGKNRQVRKMTAAIGFPTLRLIRVRIGKIQLNGLKPGDVKELKIKSINTIV